MKRHRQYTLIEVLVAVAVLVLMMSFLFQFTAGAQRIWMAHNGTTNITDNSDTLFSLLNDDLTQMQVNADDGLKYEIAPANDNLKFYTLSTSKGELLYVEYYFDTTNHKLYRFEKSLGSDALYDSTNNTAPKNVSNIFQSEKELTDGDDAKEVFLVADGVEEFRVKAVSNGSSDVLPNFIQVKIGLCDASKRKQLEEDELSETEIADKLKDTKRVFSQVFFIGMR